MPQKTLISKVQFKFWKNKNIIDVIDPFPDIFDNFDSFFYLFLLIIDHF